MPHAGVHATKNSLRRMVKYGEVTRKPKEKRGYMYNLNEEW